MTNSTKESAVRGLVGGLGTRATRTVVLAALALALSVSGCKKAEDVGAGSEPKKVAERTEKPAELSADKPADEPGGKSADKKADDCDHETTPPATKVVATEPSPGHKVLHGGEAFSDAPVVAVSEILAHADKYKGKVVKVSGDVSAMCHHRRGWFAVTAGDKSGMQLRVITMPVFKVPEDAIGTSATAEGTVDIIEVSAKFAAHLAAEHKLDEPAAGAATARQIVLRATAADFVQAPSN